MKILIVSQYFWPENFRINDLALELKARGHEVEVLTGKPNYPKGSFFDGYSFFTRRKDSFNGIKIKRVPLIPRKNGSSLQLMLNYLSFVFFACVRILFSRKKYDATITFATSPITQIYPALLHKRLYKSKALLWVQDLWPESVTAAGKINSPFILKALDKMVANIYKKTDKILVQSPSFIDSVKIKGGRDEQIEYIPNWAEDLFVEPVNNVPENIKKIIPNGFVILFAGNIGEAQDFDSILKAALLTKENIDIHWVIVGDGRKKAWVDEQIKELNLEETFHMLGRFPLVDMPYFFSLADIMLVSLKDEEIFSLTIPSKIQSYMATGKPILSMINGIGNKIINDSDCGFTADAGDYEKLAENVLIAYNSSADDLFHKGQNGKSFYEKEFDKQTIIDKLLALI